MFVQTVNEASTLGWGTRIKGFIACFVVGVACTVLVRVCDVDMAKLLCMTRKRVDAALQVLLALRDVVDTMFIHWQHEQFLSSSANLSSEMKCRVSHNFNNINNHENHLVFTFFFQGVCVLFLPKIGLTLFIVFYTFGNICALCRLVCRSSDDSVL